MNKSSNNIRLYDIKQFNVTPFKKYSFNIDSIIEPLIINLDQNNICWLPKDIIVYYDNRAILYGKKKYNKKYYYVRLMIAHKSYPDNKGIMSFSLLNLIKSEQLPLFVKIELWKKLLFVVKFKSCPCCGNCI